MPDYVWLEIFLSICCCNLLTWKDLEKGSYEDSPTYHYSI